VEINLHSDSPASRRANELARELVTARATDQDTEKSRPDERVLRNFAAALTRVMNEVLAGDRLGEDTIERISALVAALSLIASTMAWVYADEMAGIGEVDHRESLEDVLQVMFRILAENGGKSL
jgi:hypothetical protein